MMPSLSGVRERAMFNEERAAPARHFDARQKLAETVAGEDVGGGQRETDWYQAAGLGRTPSTLAPTIAGGGASPPKAAVPAERQVIRKATIELATKDVRAAFLKAAHLISEAQGEYVQESDLTGGGERVEGNLTLRVAAERLSSVLNDLRQLGEVRSEKSTGEDVTAQVVDLEARLRNEQRVETELLQLLETRKDAPLKEILELRNTIGQVRQSIEQLTAQRDRLSRLVALATVLVIIRPADAPAPVQAGLGGHFADSFSAAWRNGVVFLADTLAGLLGILVGGLVWWIVLIGTWLFIRAYVRRRARSGAT
jgi:hypothetical protein